MLGMVLEFNIPINTSLLPINTGLLPIDTSLLPINTDLLPINTSLLPINTSLLLINTSLLPINTSQLSILFFSKDSHEVFVIVFNCMIFFQLIICHSVIKLYLLVPI